MGRLTQRMLLESLLLLMVAGVSRGNSLGQIRRQAICRNDECSTSENPANRCVRELFVYRCDCGPGYSAVDGGRKCVKSSPCTDDPCSTAQHPANACIPYGNGSHVCRCNGPGWSNGRPDSTFCVPPLPPGPTPALTRTSSPTPQPTRANGPCSLNPCRSQEDARNVCTEVEQDFYTCECNAPGWGSSLFRDACLPPVEFDEPPESYYPQVAGICSERDPCNSKIWPENVCIDTATDTYVCSCASGWVSTLLFDSCSPPAGWINPNALSLSPFFPESLPSAATPDTPAPGNSRDACNHNHCSNLREPTNKCIPGFRGTYRCECNEGKGWMPLSRDLFCVTRRATLAPTRTIPPSPSPSEDGNNGGSSSGYADSDAEDSSAPAVAPTATELPPVDEPVVISQCSQGDPCLTREDRDNICIDLKDDGYVCLCQGVGFVTPFGGHRCERCLNPCLSTRPDYDPCNTLASSNNKCIFTFDRVANSAPSSRDQALLEGDLRVRRQAGPRPRSAPFGFGPAPSSLADLSYPVYPNFPSRDEAYYTDWMTAQCPGYTCACGDEWRVSWDKLSCVPSSLGEGGM